MTLKHFLSRYLLPVFLLLAVTFSPAQQTSPVKDFFPEGTKFIENIPYTNSRHPKHLLDIYIPASYNNKRPLVIWVHGGGWRANDKYCDMAYMKNTIHLLINNGIAVASIDYRYSSDAVFPAQIQDCNDAIAFLFTNASRYNFDKHSFFLMGFSAGGYLASLAALSANNKVRNFYRSGKIPKFTIKGVINFYGIVDLLAMPFNSVTGDSEDYINELIGASVTTRPDLARRASPSTYIDKEDMPFLIIHGEKDATVPLYQSKILHSWLNVNRVHAELIVVKGAPHFGTMFDTPTIGGKILTFIQSVP